MKRTLVIDIIAAFFVLLFVYAAFSKLLHYATFAYQLSQSPLLSPIAAVLSWLLPAVELGIVILLLNRRWRFAGLFASFSLVLLFTWYITIIVFFSEYLACPCDSILLTITWNQHLVFDCICVLLSSTAVLLYQPKLPVKPQQELPYRLHPA